MTPAFNTTDIDALLASSSTAKIKEIEDASVVGTSTVAEPDSGGSSDSNSPVGISETTEPTENNEQIEPIEPAVDETDTILANLFSRMGTVEDSVDYFRALIYGPPGVGKTVFTCGAGPGTLLVDIEKGKRSLKNHPELKDVMVLEFVSVFQLERLIDKIAEGKIPWLKTLIIDSYTELQKRDLDDVLKYEASLNPSRNKYIPTGPDYNANTEHMRQIASTLRNLPINVIATCHVKEEKDESSGRLLVRPNLTAKLAGTMNHTFDTVGYMTMDGEIRRLQVHPTDKVTAKTRIGGLPTVIDNPNIAELMRLNNLTSNQ
jgi:hypothetical protein